MILLTTAPPSVVFSVTFFATPRTVAHSHPRSCGGKEQPQPLYAKKTLHSNLHHSFACARKKQPKAIFA